ncbi:SpvB/TcaC N-terminal domain-containing protein, partial [Enterobacter asburiae]
GTENNTTAGYSDASLPVPQTADAALALTAPLPVSQCVVYVADSWMREGDDRLPPHVVTLTTDRFDGDPGQQVRQQVAFSDGFGRVLQTAARQVGGEAWQRAEDGSLTDGADGAPAIAQTVFRWGGTGRTEYDNKGQAIRTCQPYFLDSWKYVSDDSARHDLYADTHYYDPTGREWQVKTAKGWLRRTLFTPWFVVSEDENDTAAETDRSE